ncbi:ComF family protein [Ignavibacterium sp.]|uniref:ComF family protein n=1 Tax=Ignavibacterium sp. TaxID=2651167 RepID=UPI00307F44D6
MSSELLNKIFDFFLPRICPACNQKLKSFEELVCDSCFSKLKLTPESLIKTEYENKFASKNFVSEFHPVFVFEDGNEIQHIIHALKYKRQFRAGIYLGKIIAHQISQKLTDWEIELIIPIPLHSLKKAARGYNQSEFIAKGLSIESKIPFSTKAIQRKKFTETQTHLSALERQQNVKDAFKVKNKKLIEGKTILLVDDVITTGSTISECAKVLLGKGAKQIYAASVAIAE